MAINQPRASKINWTNALGLAAIVAVMFVPEVAPLVALFAPSLADVVQPFEDPKIQAASAAGIGAATQAASVIFRTWFTEK